MLSYKDAIYAIIIIVLVVFMLKQCGSNKAYVKEVEALNTYKTQAKHYKDKSTGLEVAYNDMLNLSNQSLAKITNENKSLKSLVKKYKTVSAITTNKTVTRIDSLYIPLKGNPCDSIASFYVDSPHYYIGGNVARKRILIDQINVINEQSIVVGQLKRKLFKPKEYQVSIMNTNPYIVTTDIGAYTFKPKTKIWQKKEVWGALGLVIGFVIKK